jgi:hypothetical protein
MRGVRKRLQDMGLGDGCIGFAAAPRLGGGCGERGGVGANVSWGNIR